MNKPDNCKYVLFFCVISILITFLIYPKVPGAPGVPGVPSSVLNFSLLSNT